MFRKILVAYDGSAAGRLAVDECLNFFAGSGAEVHVAGIVHNQPLYLLAGEFVPEPALDDSQTSMESDLKVVAAELAAKGFTATTHQRTGDPIDVMTQLVEKLSIDLVILGHLRSKSFAQRWWRGSVDTLLIERIRCSILIAADPGAPAKKKSS